MKVFLLTITFLLASFFSLYASPLCDMKMYYGEDGFQNSSAIDIIQAKNGLIWTCSRNGLTKFDGYTFTNYKSYPGDGCTMDDSRINKITENVFGNIWCRTQEERVYLFDVSSNTFVDVLQNIEDQLQRTFRVTSIYTLPKGVTWVVSEGEYAFRIEDDKYKEGQHVVYYGSKEHSLKGSEVYNVYQDQEGDEWVFTDKGISIVGRKEMEINFPFSYFQESENDFWLAGKEGYVAKCPNKGSEIQFVDIPPSISTIYSMNLLNDSVMTICNNKGLLLINIRNNKQKLISTPSYNKDVYSVYQDRLGDLWLLSYSGGVMLYEKNTEKISYYQSPVNPSIKHEKTNKSLIMEDAQGYLWLIPQEGNLCYFDRQERRLKYYYSQPENPQSLISPSIRCYCIDQQKNIWFGTGQTFGKLSFFSKNYEILDHQSEVRAMILDHQKNLWVASKDGELKIADAKGNILGYMGENGKLSSKRTTFKNMYALLEDSDGNFWLGTRNDGLYVLRPKKENAYDFTVEHYVNESSSVYSLSNNSIYALFQDSHGRIWIGTYGGGLNLVNQDAKGQCQFFHAGNRLRNLPSTETARIRCITENEQGVLLVGAMRGLITFSSDFLYPEEIAFFINTRKAYDANSLSNNDVMYIYIDSREDIYILTQNGGINRIISDELLSGNLKFEVITEKNGLGSDLTQSMIEDETGCLWVVSQRMLSKYDPRTRLFINFGNNAFKVNIMYSEASVLRNTTWHILVGINRGILDFDPLLLTESDYVPPIVFTDLKIQNKKETKSVNERDGIYLNAHQRNLSLSFAALDYKNPQGIEYSYIMEGFESEWHEGLKNRTADYINLSPGRYHFCVKSTNGDGVWVNNMRRISVDVTPTFWETGWAWLTYIVVLLLSAGGIVYVLFTIYRLRHKVDMEQQLSNIKLRFFTDISHELRTPLTLISSPVTDVLEHEKLSDTARENLTIVQRNTNRMLRMVNQILDFRKIQNKKMKMLVEETDILPFISRIMDNFTSIATEKNIDFRMDTDLKRLDVWLDQDKFEKIVFNLLSNAFKYISDGKFIIVRILQEDQHAVIIVKDDGIGIAPQKLSNLFQRFESLVNQDVLQPSSGIGLSLVKELVEMHHGSIDVSSQVGSGSEFKVSLPLGEQAFEGDKQVEFILADGVHSRPLSETESFTEEEKISDQHIPSQKETETPSATAQAGSNATTSNRSKKERRSILVVEDNAELLHFLRNILSHDYEVLEAQNGQIGLEKAIEFIPDIIVSDVMMPIMDGLDMVRAIKENKNICHIPIIILSSKASLDDRVSALEKGIDDYITKPFNATYLKVRIKTLLEQRQFLQSMYLTAATENQQIDSVHIEPSQPQITSYDELFIQQVMDFMEKNIDNTELTIDDFANFLSMGRTVFYKKTKSLLGLSPVDFILEFRLKRAIQLIQKSDYPFSEIAYMCGFSDLSYLGKRFKKYTGMTLSEYRKNHK